MEKKSEIFTEMEASNRRCNAIAKHIMGTTRDVFVVSYSRTPLGCLNGVYAGVPATKLGATAIAGALSKLHEKVSMSDFDEVIMGHVLQAGTGQAPARQAALEAGIPVNVPCSSINKVCASGLKAVSNAAMSISFGYNDICVAGGMESMTRVPHLLGSLRGGKKLGDDTLVDGLIRDGLWDVYNDQHMGNCAEKTAREFQITREDMDAYAVESARRSIAARDAGIFAKEIAPVSVQVGKEIKIITDDEQISKLNPPKLPSLRPSFDAQGRVTAGNASPISDGAAAVVLMSGDSVRTRGVTPIARVISWADGERDPVDFGIAPSIAIQRALAIAGLSAKDIDLWEINEAFAAVVLANMKLIPEIRPESVNVHGGAISLGHPLGCSGARIVCTLLNAMTERGATLGCAAICNGGGGSTAVIFRRV